MSIPYFPGCTLHTKARGLDSSTRESLAALGLELTELPEWTCCGTVFPLARDNYMGMVGAARILANAAKQGDGRLVTVCAFCFNVLKRVNYAMQNDRETRQKLNDYLEEDYAGETKILHPLEIIRDELGFEALKDKAGGKLKGMKVACYYGCMLTRPAEEMAFGDSESPAVMDEMARAIGLDPVLFPQKTKCCGSYQLLKTQELVLAKAREIIEAARQRGARTVVTSCPLCQFNLDWMQESIAREDGGFVKMPVLYFTQLLGLALGVPVEKLGFDQHYVDPAVLLEDI